MGQQELRRQDGRTDSLVSVPGPEVVGGEDGSWTTRARPGPLWVHMKAAFYLHRSRRELVMLMTN